MAKEHLHPANVIEILQSGESACPFRGKGMHPRGRVPVLQARGLRFSPSASLAKGSQLKENGQESPECYYQLE